jgi:hypothetical protein
VKANVQKTRGFMLPKAIELARAGQLLKTFEVLNSFLELGIRGRTRVKQEI